MNPPSLPDEVQMFPPILLRQHRLAEVSCYSWLVFKTYSFAVFSSTYATASPNEASGSALGFFSMAELRPASIQS
jgi:hypothetical protein